MKNLSLFLAILFLTGCQTIEKYSQCDADKNYFNVNNALFDEYKTNYENGNVKSYYFDLYDSCALDSCFNNYDLDFWEVNLKRNNYNGIYKIFLSENKDNPNCYFKIGDLSKDCYIVEKINKPVSKYQISLKKIDNIIEKKFIDRTTNKNIIVSSIQTYTINNSFSGSNLSGFCENSNDLSSSDYQFPKLQKK